MELLAEFLMQEQKWEKALEVQERILKEGGPLNKAGAFYGMAQAHVRLNQLDKAKACCDEIKRIEGGRTWQEFSRFMKKVAPQSVHSSLNEYLEGETTFLQAPPPVVEPLLPRPHQKPICR